MAIDEAILTAQQEKPNPTLRFYDWTTPAFSFGYFQDIAAEVDIEACRSEGIELVKRMTGGGTVVHGWDVTYTLILPRQAGEIGVSEAYQHIGRSLVKAFEKLNIPAECYTDKADSAQSSDNICLTNPAENDVMCNGKKLAGVSVRRNRNGVLFQGYISLDMPPDPILKRVSKHPAIQEMLCKKSAAINMEGRFTTRDSLIQAICETYEVEITFSSGKLLETEKAQAETLANAKYATEAWNFH
ncbi:MAG: biotin/lipoate A/B protein ligase family protein [Candidatus Poribacteria bacterium]|nr:biotin/lipoate A/B protein ligase family protein [Candidatus Poribacteria bacterium]